MGDDRLEKSSLVKFAGLALGIVIGGPVGPIVFTPAGLSVPAAATAGSFFGAILGYAVTSALVSMEARRRDRELQQAADAVRIEAGLPESVTIKVRDARITLEGEVEDYAQRHRAEQVVSTLPGFKGVTNRIRLRPAAGPGNCVPRRNNEAHKRQPCKACRAGWAGNPRASQQLAGGSGRHCKFVSRGVRSRERRLEHTRCR
jgi:BON domain-containing protein